MNEVTFRQINPALLDQLRPVIRRDRWRRVINRLAIVWTLLAIAAVVTYAFNRSAESTMDPYLPSAWIWIFGVGVFCTITALITAIISVPTATQIAQQVEDRFPDLDSALLTAIEQKPHESEGLSFFQYDVIQKAIHHSASSKWASVVPGWKLASSTFSACIGLAGAAAVCLLLFLLPPPKVDSSLHLFKDIEQPLVVDFKCQIQPGNTEVEKGTNLLVLAEFAVDTPPEATLHYFDVENNERIIPMTKSLDDPVFAGRIMQVDQPINYQVKFADDSTESFSVGVFEFPRLVRTDVELDYPKYANLERKVLQDTRRFSAVVGTKAKLLFYLNKEVKAAILRAESEDGQDIPLNRNAANSMLFETSMEVESSEKYRLHLVDDRKRENRTPPRLTVKALVNQPPELKLLEPARDIAVSALQEVSLSASVRDDFGLTRAGLAWSIGGGETIELELTSDQIGRKKHVVDHMLELETLNVKPDQLVSWHFWAEDIGAEGQTRRTESDMFFAEVRKFEEIFLESQGGQGQQQGQGQGQGAGAQQAMELAELQKEINSATWRVLRREKKEGLTDEFNGDIELLTESQKSAIGQVDELAEKLRDEKAKSLVDELKSFMNDAIDHLDSAMDKASVNPLSDSIRSQQSAYQTLLRMRAREVQVQQSRQQQNSQAQGSQQSRQQMMQQMELTQQEDRYEQERLAQEESEQAQQQKENRQILSRLRELARRQNDLNKRLKELQSALEEAESEKEKEELRRQLKRLEEEQKQLLRDTDELQERMESSQQQQAEQMEQLQQARENAQRSSEAIRQGDLSKAATEGTRAERELKELRDEFQKKTAGQFNEQMRQMRNEARDLQQQQESLARQLENEQQDASNNNRLDGEDQRQKIADGIKQGKEKVEDLREKVKQTIEEADEIEPLLADELYETYRETEQSRPDRILEYSAEALERGFDDDAQRLHDAAVEGIEDLRNGIDSAAERVLGDETEALKVARDTIKQLSRELEDEIERNAPESSESERDGQTSQASQSRSRGENSNEQQRESSNKQGGSREQRNDDEQQSSQAGQQSGQNQQQGENQQGENREGENQQGENQGREGRGDSNSQNRGTNRLDGEPQQQQYQQQGGLGGLINQGNTRNFAPITGDDFREWSDRLRDIEEMIADSDLRADAARIRDKARAIRKDLKRHSPKPDWDKIKLELAEPLAELRSRVTQEILRRDPKNELVPLNREPVPVRYENAVRKYYETLGAGQ